MSNLSKLTPCQVRENITFVRWPGYRGPTAFIFFLGLKKKRTLQTRMDFTEYRYSIASYYKKGIKQYDKLDNVNDVLL